MYRRSGRTKTCVIPANGWESVPIKQALDSTPGTEGLCRLALMTRQMRWNGYDMQWICTRQEPSAIVPLAGIHISNCILALKSVIILSAVYLEYSLAFRYRYAYT